MIYCRVRSECRSIVCTCMYGISIYLYDTILLKRFEAKQTSRRKSNKIETEPISRKKSNKFEASLNESYGRASTNSKKAENQKSRTKAEKRIIFVR